MVLAKEESSLLRFVQVSGMGTQKTASNTDSKCVQLSAQGIASKAQAMLTMEATGALLRVVQCTNDVHPRDCFYH